MLVPSGKHHLGGPAAFVQHLIADLHFAGRGDRAPALQPGDLVLLEQKLDALGVAGNHIALVGQHLQPIDRRCAAHQTHFLKVFMHFMQRMRGVQQRL